MHFAKFLLRHSPSYLCLFLYDHKSSLALCCIHSNMSLSLLYWGDEIWTQHHRQISPGLSRGGKIISSNLLTALLLMQQRMLSLLRGILLAHIQLPVHQDPQDLFCKAAFWPISPSLQWCVGLFLLMCRLFPLQDFALFFVELDNVPVSPFILLVDVLLNGSKTAWCINYSSQFCIWSSVMMISVLQRG